MKREHSVSGSRRRSQTVSLQQGGRHDEMSFQSTIASFRLVISAATRLSLLALVAVFMARPACANDILAKGKGVQVTQSQLDEAFITFRASMAAQGVPVQEQRRAAIERQLIEKLVLTQILLSRATEADRATAREKVKKLLETQRARAKSPAQFDAQIRASGISPQQLEQQLIERATCEEVLDRALRPQFGITPEMVREYYDKNPREFDQPERARVVHILISTRNNVGQELTDAEKKDKLTLAKRILERAKKG